MTRCTRKWPSFLLNMISGMGYCANIVFQSYYKVICFHVELHFPFRFSRKHASFSLYGDTFSARKRMMNELRSIIEGDPLFQDKLKFPHMDQSRLRRLINQRYICILLFVTSCFVSWLMLSSVEVEILTMLNHDISCLLCILPSRMN